MAIGALASYLAGAASERTRWRRERSSRWDEWRAQAYVERTATWESVLLLGHPETITAARTWNRRVWQVERFTRGQRADTDQWDAVHEDINADRGRFYAAVAGT